MLMLLRGDRRGLPRPGGRRALQPLGGGLHREARRLRRTDDRPGHCDAGGRRGGGPRRHRPPGGTARIHRRFNSETWQIHLEKWSSGLHLMLNGISRSRVEMFNVVSMNAASAKMVM
ncbi:hypothetical protein ACQJBY_042044 [Aegilops geniculata]